MMRRILIRFDDICATMNWQQWNKAKTIFDLYSIKPLLGVIPNCKDPSLFIEKEKPEFWEYIQQLQKDGFTIGMHGYEHSLFPGPHGIANRGVLTEFTGLSFDTQYDKIARGKEILDSKGIYTNIFIAPAHSYDNNTLKALNKVGFQYISDGKSSRPYSREGIVCVPCRSSGCPQIGKHGSYTAVFHAHEWIREDKSKHYKLFENLCKKYHEDIVSFDTFSSNISVHSNMQILDEKIYILFDYEVRPFLSRIKHSLVK